MKSAIPLLLRLGLVVATLYLGIATGGASAGADTKTEPTPLRLEQLIEQLLERNPEIASRTETMNAETARAIRARVFADPVVQIGVENLPFGSSMGTSRASALPPMINYQVSQMFMFPGKRTLMGLEADRSAEMASARADTTRQDLVVAAQKMFFDLYLNRQARQINEASRKLVENLRQIALARYSSGQDAHHDVLRAQVEGQGLQNDALTLEQQRASMVGMLNVWLNQPSETPLGEPEATWSPPRALDLAELKDRALEKRPELKEMGAMASQEHTMASLARKQFYPDFMVMGMYQQMIGDMDAWGGGVSFSVPIWLGKKQAQEARERDHRAASAEKSLEAMRAMVRFQVQDAVLKIQTTERRIQLLEKLLLPKAEEALQALIAAYSTSRTDFVSLIESRRTLQDLQLGLEQARTEREQRLADLERATGSLLERKSRGVVE